MRNNKSKIIDQIYSLASSNNSSEVNKLLTTNPLKIIDPNNYELEMSALKGYSSASHIESILKLLKNCEDKKFSARAMNFLYGCSIYLLARNGYKLKVDEILQNYNDVLLINAIEGYADNSEYHEEGIKLIFAHSNNSKIMLSLPFFNEAFLNKLGNELKKTNTNYLLLTLYYQMNINDIDNFSCELDINTSRQI